MNLMEWKNHDGTLTVVKCAVLGPSSTDEYVARTREEFRSLFGWRFEDAKLPVTLYGSLAARARAASVARVEGNR